MSGMLIAVEGLDGCGKSTVVMPELIRLYQMAGYETACFHVLKNTRLNEHLYRAHVNHSLESTPTAQQFLTAAMFRDSFDKNVLPALREGKVVIMDRWVNSMFVYQYGSLYMDQLIYMATDGTRATQTIFCDVDYENSVKRVGIRGSADGRDVYSKELFDARRDLYHCSLENDACAAKKSTVIIDCNADISTVKKTLAEYMV